MAKIAFTSGVTKADQVARRSVDTILGGGGPSARGSSFYKSVMGCPREHALVYVHKLLRKQEADNLATGSIAHKAWEAYYSHILTFQKELDAAGHERDDYYFFGCQLEAQRAAWASIAVFASEPGYTYVYEAAERILNAYFDSYAGLDRWRILAVEETLHFTSTGWEYSARLDLVIECDGRTWLVEHKTAKAVSADSLDAYDMDMQTLGQQWLFERCVDPKAFPPLAGCIVNIVTKHKTAQMFRKEVCPTRDQLLMFEESIAGWNILRDTMAAANWPRALGHCAGFARGYGKCQFFDPCKNFPHLSAEQLAANPPDGFEISTRGE